jgi:hypothetical protein
MSRFAHLVVLSLFITLARSAAAKELIDLSPKSPADEATKVTIQLDAGGHSLVRAAVDQQKAAAKDAAPEQRLPISVSAKFAYEEHRLATATKGVVEGTPLAVRYYDEAAATIKVENRGHAPELPENRRLIVLAQAADRATLYCPDGPLTRDQLDLIDVVGNTTVLDQLLPTTPVAEGSTWSNDSSVMGPLLTLDSVAVCEVQSILEGLNADYAKVRLAGTVHGSEDGAATQQEVRAVYLFDRRQGRITKLNLAVQAKRAIGGATPGLEAVAKLQITIDPLKTSTHLTEEILARAVKTPSPLQSLLCEAPTLGFRVRHDRQWFVTGEQRESMTLKRVDRGDLIAQTTLTMLPVKSAGRQTTLEEFQQDITYTLGKNFGELVSSRQWQNAAGHFCFEVIVRGLVEELPVEWHYYLVAPESGHRVSIAVTIEKPMVERLGHADRDLAESLELFPPMPAAQTAVADDGSDAR